MMDYISGRLPEHDCPEPGCEAKAGSWCAVLPGGVPWQHDSRPLSSWMPGGHAPETASEAPEQAPAPATTAGMEPSSTSSEKSLKHPGGLGLSHRPRTRILGEENPFWVRLGHAIWILSQGNMTIEENSEPIPCIGFFFEPNGERKIGEIFEPRNQDENPDVIISFENEAALDVLQKMIDRVRLSLKDEVNAN